MGKYWTETRLKISRPNCKSCDSMSEIRGLRWPSPSGFADCDTPLFLGLIPLPVQSSVSWLWHSQHLGISNTPQFTFTDPHNGFLVPSCRDSSAMCLTGHCLYTITTLPLNSVLFILTFFSDEYSNFLVYSISLATSVERAIFSPTPGLLCLEILEHLLSLNQ